MVVGLAIISLMIRFEKTNSDSIPLIYVMFFCCRSFRKQSWTGSARDDNKHASSSWNQYFILYVLIAEKPGLYQTNNHKNLISRNVFS